MDIILGILIGFCIAVGIDDIRLYREYKRLSKNK